MKEDYYCPKCSSDNTIIVHGSTATKCRCIDCNHYWKKEFFE